MVSHCEVGLIQIKGTRIGIDVPVKRLRTFLKRNRLNSGISTTNEERDEHPVSAARNMVCDYRAIWLTY